MMSRQTHREMLLLICAIFFFFFNWSKQYRRLHPCYNSREDFVYPRSKTVFALIMKNNRWIRKQYSNCWDLWWWLWFLFQFHQHERLTGLCRTKVPATSAFTGSDFWTATWQCGPKLFFTEGFVRETPTINRFPDRSSYVGSFSEWYVQTLKVRTASLSGD